MSDVETPEVNPDPSARLGTGPSTGLGTGPSTGLRTGPSTGLRTGNAGKGRPKGSRNKVTLAAREAILLAAEGLGGVDALIAWVRKDDDNERIFWSVIYPKVLPLGGGPSETDAATMQVTGALVWRPPEMPGAEAAEPEAELEDEADEDEDAEEDEAQEGEPAAADAGAAGLPGLPGGPPISSTAATIPGANKAGTGGAGGGAMATSPPGHAGERGTG